MAKERKPPPLPPIEGITRPISSASRADAPSAGNLTDRSKRYRVHFNKPLPLVVSHQGIGQLTTDDLEWTPEGVWIKTPEMMVRAFVPFGTILMIVAI